MDEWATDVESSTSSVHTIEGRTCFVIRNYTSEVSEIQAEVTLYPDASPRNGQRQLPAEARKIHAIIIPKIHEMMESRRQFVENALFDCIRDHNATRV